jgi:subfamily B ATP-binding cassette protein MsbA
MFHKIVKTILTLAKGEQLWQENRLFLREFKYFYRVAILAILFTLLGALFEGAGVGFILSFLQGLTTPDARPLQTGVSWFDITVLGIHASATQRLLRVCILILLANWLQSLCSYLANVFSGLSQVKLTERLRVRLFEQLQLLSLSYFTKIRAGTLVNSLTGEVYQISLAFNVVSSFFTIVVTLTVYLTILFLISWQLSLVSIILFSLLVAGITNLLKQVREISFASTRANSWYSSIIVEFIHGIRTIQSFAAQDFERKRFDEAIHQITQAAIRSTMVNSLIGPITSGSAAAILVGIIILGFSVFIPANQLEAAALLTFLLVLLRVAPIVGQINGTRGQFRSLQGPLANIKELLRTDDKPYLQNGTKLFTGLKQSIQFVSVDFGYTPDQLVLRNLNFTIEQGKTTALVGASGAGKTTLADLIPRFYDPTFGNILIDGVDAREFEISSLRNQLAIVSQDTFIFNASVRENIAYAMPEASDAAVWNAAERANALEFIQTLPEGLDTPLGDRGVRLSGGQRQRIAIARALLRDPDILILDEATSALDSISERLIQESLERLSAGRTVITIAHRLSTIARADNVIVLEQGQIVEQGTYQELLDQNGKLWKYHQMQHEISPAR